MPKKTQRQKRSRSSSPPGSPVDQQPTSVAAIRNISMSNVELRKTTKKKKSTSGGVDDADTDWYRVTYTVFVQSVSAGRKLASAKTAVKRIKVTSEAGTQQMDDPSTHMMNKTRNAIRRKVDENEWGLDCSVGAGPLFMETDDYWKYLWVYAESEISKQKLEAAARSTAARKGHQTRVDAVVAKEWERGDGFKDADEKWRAKVPVLSALEQYSQKDMSKAEPILRSIVSELSKEGLHEEEILSDKTKQKMATVNAMVESASLLINQMTKKLTLKSTRLLTGLCAMLAPQSAISNVSVRDFSDVLNINRNAKYIVDGFENRKEYNKFLELDGPIQIGEHVVCRGGDGTLVSTEGDSLTIKLQPWGTKVTYKSLKDARMRRFEPQLDNYNRKDRCDKTPDHVIETIDSFFRRHVPMSPNKFDTLKKRHPLHRIQVEEKQPMYRYETMDELWATFTIEHAELAEQLRNDKQPNKCPMLLYTHAPWEMVKARDVSCLCINCEGMNATMRGVSGATAAIDSIIERVGTSVGVETEVARLMKIRNIINTPSKYDMCVECLKPCLASDKLEDAEHKCIDGTCDQCGFQRQWSQTLRRKLFVHTLGQEPTMNQDSPLYGPEWTEANIDWRQYSYEVQPTKATHAQEVARQAAAARAAEREDVDADDEEYNPNESSASSRKLVLTTKRGTLIDFLDTFQEMNKKHVYHRNLVAVERRAQLNHERNIRPGILDRKIDYSENGSINDINQVQSQYWITLQYTLFVSIVCWLRADIWNKTEGILEEQNEVTVNGEMFGQDINEDSYWARVTKVLENDMYEVTDANNKTTTHHRRDLRLRQKHTVAMGHVTDDKTHDRHSMQHFTTHELEWLENYMNQNFPADIPTGRITLVHQHSDNAGQHFKNTGAIHYYTSLTKDRGEAVLIYSFGAPSHGKGPHDGVGGCWKTKVDTCIRSSYSTGRLLYTDTGYIQNVKDVYDALVHHFEQAEHRNVPLAGKNPIHKYKFFIYTFDNNPIERPLDEKYITLDGISKHYQFVAKSEGVVHMRQRSCWCLRCMKALTKPSLGWGTPHSIVNCDALSRRHGANNSAYAFSTHACTKTAGRDVAARIIHERDELNNVSTELCVGDWIIFHGVDENGNEDPDQPLWLGRVMSNPDDGWDGGGVKQNTTTRAVKYPMGVEIKKNEVAIYVQWYEKIDLNSTEPKYHVSRTITKPQVQSNQLLLHTGFAMTQLRGDNNPVPKSRPASERRRRETTATASLGEYARPRQNNQRSSESWHDKEYGIVWEMTETDRDYALGRREV
eukprot:scaffold7728_cov75-Skeletonema_dohrnii-CCMP3373.AAC.2